MSENPYEYLPRQDAATDLTERDWLAEQMRSFVDGTSTDPNTINNLYRLADDAEDPVVKYVSEQFIRFEHLGRGASKQDWDHLQRLLLLVESRHSLATEEVAKFHAGQLFGVLSIAALGLAAIEGTWAQFMLVSTVLNLIALVLLRRWTPKSLQDDASRTPFNSIQQLKAVCAEVNFRKQRYPYRLTNNEQEISNVGKAAIMICIAFVPVAPVAVCLFPHASQNVSVVMEGVL